MLVLLHLKEKNREVSHSICQRFYENFSRLDDLLYLTLQFISASELCYDSQTWNQILPDPNHQYTLTKVISVDDLYPGLLTTSSSALSHFQFSCKETDSVCVNNPDFLFTATHVAPVWTALFWWLVYGFNSFSLCSNFTASWGVKLKSMP